MMGIEILGKGLQFPMVLGERQRKEYEVQKDDQRKPSLSQYEDKIKESIFIILSTAKGERVMRPDFGCGIQDFTFAVMNTGTMTMMKTSVHDALIQWEPRIEVESVDVQLEQLDEGMVFIQIDYRVISTNNQFNMVFPFYISGGK